MKEKVAEAGAQYSAKRAGRIALPGTQTTASLIDVMKNEFGLNHESLVRLTGYSLRSIASWAKGTKATRPAATKFKELSRLLEALAHITQDKREIGEWLCAPNEAFEGSTPIQVIERGEVDRIWEMVYFLRSGQTM